MLHLLDTDQIQRTERGGLIVGLAGERVTSGFKFYAVFQENEEYSVRADGQELGTLVQPPPAGEKSPLQDACGKSKKSTPSVILSGAD